MLRHANALETEAGTVTDDSEILEFQRQFYQKLYTDDPDISFKLTNPTDVLLSEEEKTQVAPQISSAELFAAVKQLKPNKTPGPDGITADFYKIFWNTLSDIFMEYVQDSYKNELLDLSTRSGVLNVIPKPGKDSRFLTNLRPITLLNTDYKIIEKAIANRIETFLPKLIEADQKGFIKGRRIAANIRKMYDVMHILDQEDRPGVVLNLDFRKGLR